MTEIEALTQLISTQLALFIEWGWMPGPRHDPVSARANVKRELLETLEANPDKYGELNQERLVHYAVQALTSHVQGRVPLK